MKVGSAFCPRCNRHVATTEVRTGTVRRWWLIGLWLCVLAISVIVIATTEQRQLGSLEWVPGVLIFASLIGIPASLSGTGVYEMRCDFDGYMFTETRRKQGFWE